MFITELFDGQWIVPSRLCRVDRIVMGMVLGNCKGSRKRTNTNANVNVNIGALPKTTSGNNASVNVIQHKTAKAQ